MGDLCEMFLPWSRHRSWQIANLILLLWMISLDGNVTTETDGRVGNTYPHVLLCVGYMYVFVGKGWIYSLGRVSFIIIYMISGILWYNWKCWINIICRTTKKLILVFLYYWFLNIFSISSVINRLQKYLRYVLALSHFKR